MELEERPGRKYESEKESAANVCLKRKGQSERELIVFLVGWAESDGGEMGVAVVGYSYQLFDSFFSSCPSLFLALKIEGTKICLFFLGFCHTYFC